MSGLVLTRRIGETVLIGDDIRITLTNVRGNQAAILIEAPKSMAVHREEVYERIKRGIPQKVRQPEG